MDGRYLRLFQFRPVGSGAAIDAVFRREALPRLARIPGVEAAVAGRHGPDETGERLVVSVWASKGALDAAACGPEPDAPLDLESGPDLADARILVLPIEVAVEPGRTEEPSVLRVFRGGTRPGELDAYLEEVRSGALADVAAGHGALALYAARAGDDRFVTVSIWSGWSVIEAATGGNIRRPAATRNVARLSGGSVVHYEVLPEGAPRALAAVD